MRSFVKKYQRHIATFFLLNILVELISPAAAMALTSGPNQPEVQEFQAINVSDMVDPSTGDCSYNVPLLEVDGYPVNLSYRSGISMDQEATFCGLGWNMNVGSISRGLRGLPDDFKGDVITKKMNMKDNESYGVTIGVGGEFFGVDGLTANGSIGLTYNNYSGYDYVKKLGFSLSLGNHASVGLGLTSSADGLTIAPNLSMQANLDSEEESSLNGSASLGTSFNSRSGMSQISLNVSASASVGKDPSLKSDKKNKWMRSEKNQHSDNVGSIGNGSSISFGSPTYVPQITMPMHTRAISASFKIGGTLFGVDVTGDIAGNYSKQKLATKELSYPAYGYLHLHEGQNNDNVMMDFNREKDGNFTEATTNLPIPNLTYDNYSVMGQGVGGSYRPFRSDVGYVFDPRASNTSDSYNLGGELSLGNTVQGGFDFVNTSVDGTSGKWTDNNYGINAMKFQNSGYMGYEPAYFKEMGEMNVDDDALFTNIHEEKAARFQLDDLGNGAGLSNQLIDENSVTFGLINKNKRNKRIKRNQLFSHLTVDECQTLALQTSLYSQMVKPNNGHHIGQITTTKTDGTRYVYGLPVYNNYQKEVSFNVSGFTNVPTNNMVSYTPGVDDTENNTKGTDHFFTSTETPAYVYAHLLTAVLSSDYVDKTGNGPTPDDIGTYTLFKYDDASTRINNYKWRTPHSGALGSTQPFANLDEGLLSNKNDNKASYVYGEKDIIYLKSIESKNHIALLQYSARNDGGGVAGDAGGNGSSPQRKLDLITLYSKPDYDLQVANPSHVPFVEKQVHFTYNYELCPGTFNSTGINNGKLTLKEIYFTYGTSNKGKLSPYKFTYNLGLNTGGPVGYNPAATDRWGNYKPNNPACPNAKYPYVEQDKTLEDQYVSLWNLKKIQLPSGGEMEINYESDDYAYIQDRRAGEMFKVVGVSNSGADVSAIGNFNLFTNQQVVTSDGNVNSYLYFKLKSTTSYSGVNGPNKFIDDYFGGLDMLYFRFYVNVNCGSNNDISQLNFNKSQGYEFIHGYAEIDKSASPGYFTSGGFTYGYVKVKSVKQSKLHSAVKEHPVSKAAWQMARTQTPKDAYQCSGSSNPANGANGIEAVLKAMADASFINNTVQFFKGYNGTLKSAGYGQVFDSTLSWVRLNNPDYKKLGGGLRVKSVKIKDKWDKMVAYNATNQGFEYGQEYTYTTEENGRVISAGVASYEPTFGADENSFRQPVFMDMHKSEALLAPDNNMYVEEPMGESFFPSPQIIYSKVSIKNLASGAGKTVNEYYTSKDFPTQVHSLGMEAIRKKPDPIFSLFSFDTYDKFTGSQGYSIELNDMHGKPKAVHQYEEGAFAPKTSTAYKYKQSGDKLLNTVKAVFKDGTIKDTKIGIDYDFYADFRENNTKTQAIGVKGNLYFMFVGIYPLFLPPILPSFHSEEIQLRTAVTNKVIYKYGIVDRTETTYNGNLTSVDNLLYDAETGQPLLTATTTEFKDPIYSTAYPGHWAYEGLSGGYKNTGFLIANPSSIVNSVGQITNPAYKNMLYPGDEIAFISATGVAKGYVDQIGSAYYFTINTTLGGNPSSLPLASSSLASYIAIKVIRSGRHNIQDQKVAAITSFTNPLYNNPTSWPVLNNTYGITQATAVELGNVWQGYCGCGFVASGTVATTQYPNQYIAGIKGNFRKIKDYTFLTQRKQTKENGNSNIRIDGTYENFSPFWVPNAGNDWVANPTNWQWVTEATKYSPYGFDLENKDALNRYSAAQYGYQQTMPVSVTSNSKYKQSANESFEYNELNFCQDDHFGFNQHKSNTWVTPPSGSFVKVQTFSHTGKRSIKVPATQTITVTKQINQCQ
ncbi:MAG: hypothetical protein K0S32_1163 [Bacteroidetes bacterium]|jgi:hypothetical protein|nr:hypothetical protein [Bacteroidota bacterium]